MTDVMAIVERRDVRATGDALVTLRAADLELLVRRAGCDPLRIELAYDDIEELAREGAASLLVETRRGDRIALTWSDARAADKMMATLLRRCWTLPELTRALRSLGMRREATPFAAEADRFFEPLIAARRAVAIAAASDPDTMALAGLESFAAVPLRQALEATASRFAQARYPERASARRALEARLCDHLEPLFNALGRLDEAAAPVHADRTAFSVRAWRRWTGALRAVFERADECWPHLARELGRTARPPGRSQRG